MAACLDRRRRRIRKNAISPMTTKAPRVQPTPMPAAAPVDSDDGDPCVEDDTPLSGTVAVDDAGDADEVFEMLDIAVVLLFTPELENDDVDLLEDLLELIDDGMDVLEDLLELENDNVDRLEDVLELDDVTVPPMEVLELLTIEVEAADALVDNVEKGNLLDRCGKLTDFSSHTPHSLHMSLAQSHYWHSFRDIASM